MTEPLTPIERALAEIEELGNKRNLLISPEGEVVTVDEMEQRVARLSGERDEALQGAIAVLRAQAGVVTSGPNKGQTGNISGRYKQWADILEEMWETLR